jgi:hypothetical protein
MHTDRFAQNLALSVCIIKFGQGNLTDLNESYQVWWQKLEYICYSMYSSFVERRLLHAWRVVLICVNFI